MAGLDDLGVALDRVTYRDGQLLTSRDLGDDHRRETRLRRLHTHHLHETWGIAVGYDVQAAGAGAVAVGPGYALDIRDRELILAANVALAVPAVQGPDPFVLAIAFEEDAAFRARADLEGVCLDHPLDPRREHPRFLWLAPESLDIGAVVPLAHVVVQDGAIVGGVQTRVRRYARRLVRPHVATGMREPEAGGWTPWYQRGIDFGFETVVDTSEAGFTSAPSYFASVQITAPSARHSAHEVDLVVAGSFAHIATTAVDRFTFRIIVPEPFIPDLGTTWAVSWVGAEPLLGCPPGLDLARLFTLAAHRFHVKGQP